MNERYVAAGFNPSYRPYYFFPFVADNVDIENVVTFFLTLNASLIDLSQLYVNPDKISSASSYNECFWTWNELVSEATDGEMFAWAANPFLPECSAKLAKQFYNAFNLLRYVPTTEWYKWPVFDYEDKNDTFKFKAP